MKSYFISSTFQDMQAERDIINMKIFPHLKKIANECGDDLSVIDLRCGIDTENMDEQQEMKRILSVCMDKINECYPHIVILLGDRYGSLPSQESLYSFLTNDQGTDFLLKEAVEKSVTELEIIHALNHIAAKKEIDPGEYLTVCIRAPLPYEKMSVENQNKFCSRSTVEQEKLNRLKKRLIDAFPDSILYYHADWDSEIDQITGLDDFRRRLTERIEIQLKKQLRYNTAISKEERQFLLDQSFLHMKADGFVDFGDVFQQCVYTLQDPSSHMIILCGDHGSGKSSLAAALAVAAQKEFKVITLFCGNGEYMSDASDVLNNLTWRLELLLGETHCNEKTERSFDEQRQRMKQLFERVVCQYNLLLIIDGLDVLHKDQHLHHFDFLPVDCNENFRMLLTTTDMAYFPQHIREQCTFEICQIDNMESGDIIPITQSLFHRMNKELPESLKNPIISVAVCHSPLYLSLLVTRLNLLMKEDYDRISRIKDQGNGGKHLNRYLEKIVEELPQTTQDLAESILQVSGKMFSGDLAKHIPCILRIFPAGCRLIDMVDICNLYDTDNKVTLLDVSIFIQSAGEIFHTDSRGCITFHHGLFSDTWISEKCLDAFRVVVFSYLNALPVEDPIRLQNYLPECFYNHKSGEAACYLAEVYGKYAGDLQQKPAAKTQQTIDAAIRSLHSLYEVENSADVTRFILDIITYIQDCPSQKINNLCACFLFTYDLLFGESAALEDREAIMNALYTACFEHLYLDASWELTFSSHDFPDEAIQWMRTIYVCCEQRGIRTTDAELRARMYQKFYEINREVLNILSKDYRWYEYFVADGAISLCKLASLPQNNWQNAADCCVQAMKLIEDSVPEYKNSPVLYYEYLKADYQRAEIFINEAILKKQIGWPAGAMDKYLEDAAMAIDAIEHYYLNHPEMREFYYYLTRTAVLRADFCRSKTVVVPDELLSCTKHILQQAEAWYNKTGEWRAMEHIRNASLRFAYDSQLPLTDEQRREAAVKSFQALQYVSSKINEYGIKKLWMYTLQLLVHMYSRKISELSNDDRQLFEKAGMCYFVLGCVKNHLEELFSGKQGDSAYCEFMNIVQQDLKCFEQMKSLCIRNLYSEEYSQAIRYGKEAEKCLDALEPLQEENIWLKNRMDLSSLMYVVYHNRDVHVMFEESGKVDFCEQSKSESECMYYILRYENQYGTCSLSENLEKIRVSDRKWDPIPWIRFAAESLKNNKDAELFWKAADANGCCIPGQQTAFFYTFRNYPDETVREWKNVIGKYFCENLSDERVKKILVNSDIFEAISLEYAYKNTLYSEAHTIILNGYLSYLELPLLLLVRKYDRNEFKKRIIELRPECLRHIRKDIKNVREYINMDYLLDDILRNICSMESKKMQELRSLIIPAHMQELYIAVQKINWDHRAGAIWMAFNYDDEKICFLRCGIQEHETEYQQMQENIIAEIPVDAEKITWIIPEDRLQVENVKQRRMIKKICGLARRLSIKLPCPKNDFAENTYSWSLDYLTAECYHFAYSRQNDNKWSDPEDMKRKEYEKWAINLIEQV